MQISNTVRSNRMPRRRRWDNTQRNSKFQPWASVYRLKPLTGIGDGLEGRMGESAQFLLHLQTEF